MWEVTIFFKLGAAHALLLFAYRKMHYIWHWFEQTVAIVIIHSLLGKSYNNYIHSTKLYIDIDPLNLSYPQAISVFSFTGNSTNDLFIVSAVHFSLRVWFLAQTHVQTRFPLPYYMKDQLLLQKLWRAAGVVRGCQYQIGHKNPICNRLNHLHRPMGILTIIGLAPQGGGKGVGHRSPEAGEGTAGHWVLCL